MTTDRYLTLAKAPTQDEIHKALGGYLNGAAEITWNDGYWICRFPQEASNPIRDLAPEWDFVRADKERWFEVELDGNIFNVRTKQQDEFVHAVAEGFVAFAKRYWRGKALDDE